MDYSIRIAGEAGQGIQTVGDTLAKLFSRSGCYLFTNQDYESRIRGGHNYYQIRLSDKPVFAPNNKIDILAAFDTASFAIDVASLSGEGVAIYDSEQLKNTFDGPRYIDIPFLKLALEHGDKIMVNTVAMGALLGILNVGVEGLSSILADILGGKGDAVVRANVEAARAGHADASKRCSICDFSVTRGTSSLMLISGIDAIGAGAVVSGCKFYSAYPMTPSTGIMNYLASKESDFDIIVEQAEDEIAAINMALGASFAGVRAMTATSGGGFSLMVEGLSLSAMTETPIVIGLGQRPGPATGLPTRTEQGELLFALHAGHGEFPRVIFAPGDPEQAFYLTNRAFDLAEKYQIPSFILFDQHLADTQWTYSGFDMEKVVYKDYRLRGNLSDEADYKRYAYSDIGISPLAVPGESSRVVVTDSDEHDEHGHITEDAETRNRMVDKRFFKKMELLKKEIKPPLLYGDGNPELLLVCWGSAFGVVKETIDRISGLHKAAMLHFSEIWPFPENNEFDYIGFLNKARITICIEQNASGQFGRLLKTETGHDCSSNINRFDGRPFIVDEIVGEINDRI